MEDLAAIVSMFTDVAGVLVGIVGLVLAVRGFKAWRRELRGTTEFHVARDILRALFRIRGPFYSVRSRGIELTDENLATAERFKMSAESMVERTKEAVEKRLKTLGDAMGDLAALEADAVTLWDSKASAALEDLFDTITILTLTTQDYWDTELWRVRVGEAQTADVATQRRIMYGAGGNDDFGDRFKAAFKKADDFFRPYVRGQWTPYRI